MKKISLWPENTGIGWWNEARKELNKVIRLYNKWVDKGAYSATKAVKLIERINNHLKMDYCNQDGGSGYKEELELIKSLVKERLLKLIEE